MPLSLKQFLQECSARVEATLSGALSQYPAEAQTLLEAMRYSTLNGGKRVRPMLVYATAGALGTPASRCDGAAAAVEAIHAYSLIHDDLPSMDDDDLRRGQPTCHIRFGEANAILAGDALQTLAFELIVNGDLAAETRVAMLSELARAGGAAGMVAGQAIDLASVDRQLDLPSLERMHRLKTGALIRASVRIGALAAGASDAQLEDLSRYADAIGLAFQVQDDILDVVADTETLGKAQGADIALNKPTYVSLLGLEGARRKATELHSAAHAALAHLDERAAPLRDLADYIVHRDH
ncbi:(2E,6E)-farnesyl diphosphate synthase [Biformimicrobium ophioploci]|nr:farnesyl diphosphate synthase [Microbulbifer sp. NKW57]